LNRPPAAAAAAAAAAGGGGGTAAACADPEAAALANLKSLCAAAGVLPQTDHEAIARRLIEHGVADEISLRDSLGCNPPAFDLFSVVDEGQAFTIMDYLELEETP
jgi:hypothetical protein